MAFSGFPEHGDETFCLLFARHLGWLIRAELEVVCKYSENEIARNSFYGAPNLIGS